MSMCENMTGIRFVLYLSKDCSLNPGRSLCACNCAQHPNTSVQSETDRKSGGGSNLACDAKKSVDF